MGSGEIGAGGGTSSSSSCEDYSKIFSISSGTGKLEPLENIRAQSGINPIMELHGTCCIVICTCRWSAHNMCRPPCQRGTLVDKAPLFCNTSHATQNDCSRTDIRAEPTPTNPLIQKFLLENCLRTLNKSFTGILTTWKKKASSNSCSLGKSSG